MAAANIDGTPYGDLPDRKLTRPFLLLQSDQAETHHGDWFNKGNGKLLAQVMGGGRGPAATQQAAADILAAFLTGPLTGAASDLAATAARYPEVLGGAVEHKPAGVASGANN